MNLELNQQTLALFLALGATLAFALSSIVFTEYSKKVSVLWMNCMKALVAFIALLLTIPLFSGWHAPSAESLAGFLFSGLIGLNIGDLFLLSAFTRLGAARTLILFGFQPLFIGIAAYFLFDQALAPAKLLAVIFLIGCLFSFSLERYRTERTWELTGLIYALVGVVLDTTGVLITKASFAASPEITPMEGNFWRCTGALIGFALMSRFRPIGLIEGLKRWEPRKRAVIIGGCLGGTYVSLLMYLSAVKIGHLASISAIAITGPMFATAVESIYTRKAPSRYLLAAFAFFCAGFYVLLTTS